MSNAQICQEIANSLSGEPSLAMEVAFWPQRLVPGLDAGVDAFDSKWEPGGRFEWVKLGPELEYLAVLDDGEPNEFSRNRGPGNNGTANRLPQVKVDPT
ncbi:hypothetical protein [Variovorax sp. J31P207]|uniref:hypothetical protein n=1 Tax=Variovorax sp. J31P207 TaxID=3053510 RepID=UPI002578E87F|nr:hypothetical protein [Variovorax sp. J31P207]MDM0070568.1 hypothetical protein [Variovorax sp. J31P207]